MLNQKHENLVNDQGEYDMLKENLRSIEAQLWKEQVRIRSLEGSPELSDTSFSDLFFFADELKTPMNIHRWRQLKNTDTEKYAVIENIQNLQRQIVEKSDEV